MLCLSEDLRDQTFDDTEQREVLAAIDQHPRLYRVVEEVCTEADQQDHDDTVECTGDDRTADAAFGIGDDRSTAVLKEAGEDQRNDDRREHASGDQDRDRRSDDGNDEADQQGVRTVTEDDRAVQSRDRTRDQFFGTNHVADLEQITCVIMQ